MTAILHCILEAKIEDNTRRLLEIWNYNKSNDGYYWKKKYIKSESQLKIMATICNNTIKRNTYSLINSNYMFDNSTNYYNNINYY